MDVECDVCGDADAPLRAGNQDWCRSQKVILARRGIPLLIRQHR
jgi:hypothetical protein